MAFKKLLTIGVVVVCVCALGASLRAQAAARTFAQSIRGFSRAFLTQTREAAPESHVAGDVLEGAIRDSKGAAIEGVVVSARAAGKTFTTSVFTDHQGAYVFPALESGRYRVWAQAVGYDLAQADVGLTSGREAKQDLILKPLEDFSMQLTGAEWVDALPSGTPADRRLKEIFQHNCTACHTPGYILQNRFDESGWNAALTAMESVLYFRYDLAPDKVKGRIPYPEIHHYKPELAAYLARMRGPGPSPMKFHALPRPTGEAARVVITEYDVPAVQATDNVPPSPTGIDGSIWSEGTPAALENQGSHDVVADRFGNAWISTNEPNRTRTYARLDTKTGLVTNFTVDSNNGWVANTHGLTVAPDGMVWTNLYSRGFGLGEGGAATGGSLGFARIDPATGKIESFKAPGSMHGGVGNFVDVDGKGKLWAVTSGGAIHFDPATNKFTEFVSPSADSPRFSTYGLAGDADGNGWWADITQDRLGHGDVATGKSSEVLFPPRAEIAALATDEDRKFSNRKDDLWPISINTAPLGGRSPRRIAADHTGRYVWAADFYGQDVAAVDIRTLKVTFYDLPVPYASAYDLRVGRNHEVWVTLRNADRVGKLDPETKKWTVYQLPTLGTECRNISVDQYTGDVWVASWRTSKVIRLHFLADKQTAGPGAN